MGRVRRHPRPPQLPLPVRRLVSDAVAGYRPSPFSGYLPEASANCRTRGSKLRVLQVDHLMSSHNSKFSGRWFELSGVHDRAPGVFPQPSKTAVWIQFRDIKWINPNWTTFGLGPVRTENTGRTEKERLLKKAKLAGGEWCWNDVGNAQNL